MMSAKRLRSETVRLIDQNATDFITDKKKSNNLIEVIGHLEVECTMLWKCGHARVNYGTFIPRNFRLLIYSLLLRRTFRRTYFVYLR